MSQADSDTGVATPREGPAGDALVPRDEPEDDVGAAVYRLLMRGGDTAAADPFDLHVIASILAIAFRESLESEMSLAETSGLEPDLLAEVIATLFPSAIYLFAPSPQANVARRADEACLLDLLATCASSGTSASRHLAKMVARRAQNPDHLWQDLGLRNRGELSRLMQRHFRALAARNTGDMKWKKFLYRMICRDAGYSLCTAPSCRECIDFDGCFGDESGESRLARTRRGSEIGAAAPAVG